MKHRVLCILITVLTMLAIAGCSGGAKTSDSLNKNSEKLQNNDNQTKNNSSNKAQSTDNQTGSLPADLLNSSWPKEALPAELPEYKDGTVTASNEADGVVYIKLKDTNKVELYTYLGRLKVAGWLVSSDDTEADAVLGRYTVNFALQGNGDYLQIEVYTAEAGEWPVDEIPNDIMQPQTGSLAQKVEILEQMDDSRYFNYTYDGIDEAAAGEYMQMLRENGWSGDDYMVTKSFEWKGKSYSASIEIYETMESRTTFTCNYWLE